MKIKIYKILGVALTVAMLVSLLVGFSVAPASAKTYDTNEWEKYEIPEEGSGGDYLLYYGSDVTAIGMSIDGTLYAGVDHGGDYEIFKSTDEGASWDMLDDYDADEEIIDIACSPVDEEVVYFASTDTVFRTMDGGEEFNALSTDPWTGETITSVDVTYYNDAHIVVISTDGAPGDVYVFDEGETFGSWADRDATTGTEDVLDAVFSPFFEEDRQIVAVITDGTDVWVTTAVEGGAWDGDVSDSQDIPVAGATRARLAFPSDYDADPDSGDYVQFLAIAAGGGDGDAGIYLIDGVEVGSGASVATALESGYDAYSIQVEGDASSANIVYGLETDAADEAMVRFSTDGGDEFDPAYKEPSGEEYCIVLIEDDTAYAATSGANSAFSVSFDAGDTWSQPGLIDTEINSIASWEHWGGDLFLFTDEAGFPGRTLTSIWKTSNMGDSWYRVMSTDVTIVQSSSKIYNYGTVDRTTFADDIMWTSDGGTPSYIWKTDDGGDTWTRLKSATTVDGTDYKVNQWKVIDESEIIFFSGYVMYRTRNGGTSWSEVYDFTEYSGTSNIASLKIDKTSGMYLVWNKDQTKNDPILISDDEGESWEEVNPDESIDGAIGNFDPDFGVPGAAGYNTVYAANDDGIWRYVIDESSDWEEISAGYTGATQGIELFPMPTIPPGSGAPDPDGTLYLYQQNPAGGPPFSGTQPGVVRTVYPTDREAGAPDYEVDFENIGTGGKGWMPGAPIVSPAGLSMFTADQDAAALYMYTDTLNKPGKLSGPSDGTTSGREGSAMLTWEDMSDADKYEVQWAEDSEFDVELVSKTTEVTSYRATGLFPGRTYYWRVRVEEGEPAWSPWSEVWSFSTALGAPQWNPFVGGIPESPANGATNVPLQPSFAWNPADWATGYEFILSDNPDYQTIVSKTGANALTNTVYLCEVMLDYDTTYYWKVRAISKTSSSEWAEAVFTTMSAPPPTPTPPTPQPTPEQEPLIDPLFLWIIIGIGAVLVIALIILIVRTRRVA